MGASELKLQPLGQTYSAAAHPGECSEPPAGNGTVGFINVARASGNPGVLAGPLERTPQLLLAPAANATPSLSHKPPTNRSRMTTRGGRPRSCRPTAQATDTDTTPEACPSAFGRMMISTSRSRRVTKR